MNYYETIIIFSTKPKEAVIKTKIKKTAHILQKYSSRKKVDTKDMGIKNLAYPIKENKQGYYSVFTWEGESEDVHELEDILRRDDDVLKFLTVKMDNLEFELEDLDSTHQESEQDDIQPDALDVLLGLAEYKRKDVI